MSQTVGTTSIYPPSDRFTEGFDRKPQKVSVVFLYPVFNVVTKQGYYSNRGPFVPSTFWVKFTCILSYGWFVENLFSGIFKYDLKTEDSLIET